MRLATRFLALGLVAALCGCSSEDSGGEKKEPTSDRVHQSSGESWTFMVYMVSDNDLEPFALQDLAEMVEVGSSDKFQILVQSDRADGYASEGVANLPDWTTAKRLRAQKGELEVLEDLGELNMGDPNTLGDFIGWAAKTAPADRYALIFWDHGGAWPGFGPDESTPEHDLLNALELKKGVKAGMDTGGIEQFALIGFDACLMSTFETAMVLRPFGEYLLASEELEPGHGWDYRSLARVVSEPSTGPIELGKDIIDGFDKQAKEQKTHAEITLGLTDLYDPLDKVDAALSDLVAVLQGENLLDQAPMIGKEREGATKYGDSPNPQQATHMIDLGHFASELGNADPAVKDATKALQDALGEAVIASTKGASKAKSTGLSIYFPPQAAYYNTAYATIEEVKTWRGFLEKYYEVAGDVSYSPQFVNPNHLAEVTAEQNAVIATGQLAEGGASLVAQATLTFGVVVPDSELVIYIGDQPATVEESGLVSASWDTTVLTLAQGTAQDYGYLSLSVEGEFLAATIPLAYREQAGAEQELVLLRIVLDGQGNEVSRTFYRITEGGPGELTPAAGSSVQTVLLVVAPASGEQEWGAASETTFDPTEELMLDMTLLGSGITIDMNVTATDFAGKGDFVGFQGVL